MYGPTDTWLGETLPPRPVRLASKWAGVSSPAPPCCCSGDVVGVSGACARGCVVVVDVVAGAADVEGADVEPGDEPDPPPPPHPASASAAAASATAGRRLTRCACRPAGGSLPSTASSTRRRT